MLSRYSLLNYLEALFDLALHYQPRRQLHAVAEYRFQLLIIRLLLLFLQYLRDSRHFTRRLHGHRRLNHYFQPPGSIPESPIHPAR